MGANKRNRFSARSAFVNASFSRDSRVDLTVKQPDVISARTTIQALAAGLAVVSRGIRMMGRSTQHCPTEDSARIALRTPAGDRGRRVGWLDTVAPLGGGVVCDRTTDNHIEQEATNILTTDAMGGMLRAIEPDTFSAKYRKQLPFQREVASGEAGGGRSEQVKVRQRARRYLYNA